MNNNGSITSKYQNIIGRHSYFNEFLSLSIARFKWKGLPDNVPYEYIEKVLFRGGEICVFEDEGLGLMFLESRPSSKKDLYDKPLFHTITKPSYQRKIKHEDCVIIKNSPSGLSYYDFFISMADTLEEIDKAIRVNVRAQKTPQLIKANDNQRLSMKKFYEQIDEGIPVIFLTDKMSLDNIEVFSTIAPFVCQDLYDTKNSLLAECYQRLGLNNITRTKKERLTESESEINEDSSNLYLDLLLETRKKACELINEKFGLSLSVEVNSNGQVYTNNTRDSRGEDSDI